jgi:predicted acetyltransferase
MLEKRRGGKRMTSRSIEYKVLSEDPQERAAVSGIQTQCFGMRAGYWDTYVRRLGPESFRVARREGQVVGALAMYGLGQWFGGQSVPMSGIAAVGVPPELRGTGIARELMAETLVELHGSGVPLSVLYASTQHLYRRVGYEQAGSRHLHAIPLAGLAAADRTLPMRAVDPERHEQFHELYRRRAQASSGNLERSTAIWERTLLPYSDEVKRGYLVGPEGAEEGYVVFHQADAVHGDYDLMISDLVALSARAARRIWAFLADHRSIAREARWWGPAVEPLLLLVPEQTAKVVRFQRWMLRIVHVRRALELRGYATDVSAELHLEVRDELLPANAGRFVVQVKDGSASVEHGGRGDLRLDVRALAPLYTGLFTPSELAALGKLEGPPQALAAAARVFAGPQPWMSEMF